MPFVESSHGRHKTDGAVVEDLFSAPLTEGGDFAEDFDRGIGYSYIFTSRLKQWGDGEWARETIQPLDDSYVRSRERSAGAGEHGWFLPDA